jgi:hypothetical protein
MYLHNEKEDIAFKMASHILVNPSSPQSARQRAEQLLTRLGMQKVELHQEQIKTDTLEAFAQAILR